MSGISDKSEIPETLKSGGKYKESQKRSKYPVVLKVTNVKCVTNFRNGKMSEMSKIAKKAKMCKMSIIVGRK